jgi:Multiubiquitin
MADDQITATASTAEARDKNDYVIIVDGQPKTVSSDVVSYLEVVELAYPGQSGDPQYTFTVTYRNADQEPREGSLVAGKTVRVKKEGTVFNVTRTTKS